MKKVMHRIYFYLNRKYLTERRVTVASSINNTTINNAIFETF